MWETVRLIKGSLPKIVIWENVVSATQGRNKLNFENYLRALEELGYANSWELLNAKDHGIPQNRNRVFVVSKLHGKFDFGYLDSKKKIKDLENFICIQNKESKTIKINQATKKGYIGLQTPGLADMSFPKSKTRRGRVSQNGKISPTLLTSPQIYLFEADKKRRITAEESFYLMGFNKSDYLKIKHLSQSEIYKLAGNSIVVNVLEELFDKILKNN